MVFVSIHLVEILNCVYSIFFILVICVSSSSPMQVSLRIFTFLHPFDFDFHGISLDLVDSVV